MMRGSRPDVAYPTGDMLRGLQKAVAPRFSFQRRSRRRWRHHGGKAHQKKPSPSRRKSVMATAGCAKIKKENKAEKEKERKGQQQKRKRERQGERK